MVSKQELLSLALRKGQLQSLAPFCKKGTLLIYSMSGDDFICQGTARDLLIRLDGKSVAVAPAVSDERWSAHNWLFSHLQPSASGSFIVKIDSQHEELPNAFVDRWFRWKKQNQRRLFSGDKVCRVPTTKVHLLCISVQHLCELVNGAYLVHMQWELRLAYLYLALECDTRIVEAVMHSQPADTVAIFHFVKLLLSCGFSWDDNLEFLCSKNLRSGLTKDRLVFIQILKPVYRTTHYELATLDLSLIKRRITGSE